MCKEKTKEMIAPYKKRVLNQVYHMYLDGIEVEIIGCLFKLTNQEINEIIDYLNELYA